MLVDGALNIYTDGSSYNSPRKGGVGIAFVLVDAAGNEVFEELALPGYRGATNNQMELQAPILALREAKHRGFSDGPRRIVIHTDSMYDLVKAIKATGCVVEFRWVKGHQKDPYNRTADKLAKRSAKSATQSPLMQVSVRRKQTRERVESGVVATLGQRLSIRVITCEYLRVQQVWRYRYEVVSKRNPFFGKVDWVYSARELLLRDGHSYHVRLNDDPAYPQLLRVFRELEK